MITLATVIDNMTPMELAFFLIASSKHPEDRRPDEIKFLSIITKLISQ